MASVMWSWCCLLNILLIFHLNLEAVESKPSLVSLNEDNWDLMLTGEWMVEFYAPWCPACKALQPTWEEFSSWSKDLNIKVGQVDVTTSPGLSGRFIVTALPTIFHVLNGEFRQYRGQRDKEAFISFVEEDKWKSVEAISAWKSPASFQMSVVAYFFKMSQLLRAVHTRLMEDYGLPTWGSYLIFAVATIIIGALLGLLFSQVAVCTIDFLSPPKQPLPPGPRTKRDEKNSGDEDSDDELAEDDIVDENAVDSSAARKRKARKAD